jgi:hypothetical protein
VQNDDWLALVQRFSLLKIIAGRQLHGVEHGMLFPCLPRAFFNTVTIGLAAKVAAAVAAENANIIAATGTSASSPGRNATFTLIVNDFAKRRGR